MQRAPEKITRFVPLRVHLLEIRRLGSWNTLPRRVQRAPEKITRFVPLRVHLLEIRWLGSWNTLPRRRSGILFSPRRIFSTTNVYICGENAVHIGGFTSCGLLLLKEECRISSFCSCLLVLANVRYMRGHRGFLLEVPSHAGMFSPRAANST